MTYSEYLKTLASFAGVAFTDPQIDFILAERGLDGTSTVSGDSDRVLIKTAIFYMIPAVIAGQKSVSEGGYSVTWNISGLQAWYSILAGELGLEDGLLVPANKIRDRSSIW